MDFETRCILDSSKIYHFNAPNRFAQLGLVVFGCVLATLLQRFEQLWEFAETCLDVLLLSPHFSTYDVRGIISWYLLTMWSNMLTIFYVVLKIQREALDWPEEAQQPAENYSQTSTLIRLRFGTPSAGAVSCALVLDSQTCDRPQWLCVLISRLAALWNVLVYPLVQNMCFEGCALKLVHLRSRTCILRSAF